MNTLFSYLKAFGIFFIFIILLALITSIINLTNINSITVNKISVILTAISFFVIPLLFAHKSNKRGIILGLKLSLSFVLLLILINIIFFKSPFNIDRLIYYLILIISGILGGSFGKNIKLKRK